MERINSYFFSCRMKTPINLPVTTKAATLSYQLFISLFTSAILFPISPTSFPTSSPFFFILPSYHFFFFFFDYHVLPPFIVDYATRQGWLMLIGLVPGWGPSSHSGVSRKSPFPSPSPSPSLSPSPLPLPSLSPPSPLPFT